MRLLLIFFSVFQFAAFARTQSERDSASLAYVLSGIWVEIPGISGLTSLTEEDLCLLGGLYLPRPVESSDALLLGTEKLPPLAIQLDTRLNPAPGFIRELPDLSVLAAIQDKELLKEYLIFLRSVGKGYGLDYLVLPEIDPTWKDAQSLMGFLVDFDSGYFLLKRRLSFASVSSKRGLRNQLSSQPFWVIRNEEYPEVKSFIIQFKNLKIGGDPRIHHYPVAASITSGEAYPMRDHLPTKLAYGITREAIIPLQKGSVLPLSADTISLVTTNPAGPFAQMLAKYAYLLTTYEGIANSQSPIIIDGTIDSLSVIIGSRPVVFTGTLAEAEKWIPYSDAVLLVPFHREWNDYMIPQVLFGAGSASGKLPDHVSFFNEFDNQPLKGQSVLGYVPPKLMGIDETVIAKVREIAEEAIRSKSTPGCQIGVAIGGSIVLEEAFGFLTYDSLISVEKHTLYDIASVSKIAGTLLALMKLYEEGSLDLDKNLGYYLPEYGESDKAGITIRQVLAHQSGLKGYIPYWRRTITPEFGEKFYQESSQPSISFNLTTILQDSLRSWIRNTPVAHISDSLRTYRYSDIGFMILHQIIERITGQELENYLAETFYSKMGLATIGYNPLLRGFDRYEIAPTEYDPDLRNELIWGDVHDQNAKIFGGVAGHAGLFSDAHDLLVVQQLILQGGRYNGHQLLHPATVAHFNTRHFENNRRGLGWDKPGLGSTVVSSLVSDASFGHSGFTGCLVWSDPVYDISFVFLSNRIFPDASNQRLITRDIRARIQSVIYEAILANWIN